MVILLVIVSLLCAVLVLLLILNSISAKKIAEQIHEIKNTNTNQLLPSYPGTFTNELINEINVLLKDVRSCKVEYQQKNHDLEQMITNISHDLRTPLTSAVGYISMAAGQSITDEERLHSIEIAGKRLKRLEELINSFFDFSKIISSGKTPELERVSLNAVLEEAVVHYYDDFCAQNRAVVLNCNVPKIRLISNKAILMRIFDNLIGNAFKHGTGDLHISVDCGSSITLSFENHSDDNEIDIKRIFDEFYTTDISRTKSNTGLGLAIAKQFTCLLGGSVNASFSDGSFCVNVVFENKNVN